MATTTLASRAFALVYPRRLYGIGNMLSEAGMIDARTLVAQSVLFLSALASASLLRCDVGDDNAPSSLSSSSPSSAARLFVIISPLSAQILRGVRTFFGWIYYVLKNRKHPGPMAERILEERTAAGRVHRKLGFDLYLPPSAGSGESSLAVGGEGVFTADERASSDLEDARPGRKGHAPPPSSPLLGSEMPGLIFLPGAMIDHAAYAPVAARLSDRGIAVVVMSVEPYRHAAPHLGADVRDVLDVVDRAAAIIAGGGDGVGADCSSGRDAVAIGGDDDGGIFPRGWSLGGHSLGAYRAMALAPDLRPAKLVVWAAGKYDALVPDLSDDGSAFGSALEVVAFQATEDKIAFMSSEEVRRFEAKMPGGTRTVLHTVEGGDHNGFADYGPESGLYGTRTISLEDQHEFVCRVTADFLLGVPTGK